jgi:hypothetical protein
MVGGRSGGKSRSRSKSKSKIRSKSSSERVLAHPYSLSFRCLSFYPS